MKKYLSIFELFARNTIYKVLSVLVLMAAVQTGLFYKTMHAWIPVDLYHVDFQAIEHYSLEWMVEESKLLWFTGVAFVCITAILCRNCCNVGSKSSYTIRRLRVTEKSIFVMQSLYNIACYLLLIGVQTAVLFGLGNYYVQKAGSVTNQTLFLAFYRNDFMHSMLPLESMSHWVTNMLIVAGCGVSAAVFTYLSRRGKVAWSLLVVVVCVVLGYVQELGIQMNIVTAILTVSIAGITAYCHVLQKKED